MSNEKDKITDEDLYAVFTNPNAGYDTQKERMKTLNFKNGDKFKVQSINMSSSSTSIRLEDFEEPFTSVFFSFVKNEVAYDIYNDPKYNSYLRNYF